MNADYDHGLPGFSSPSDCETLRSVLHRAGYRDNAVQEVLKTNSSFLRSRDLAALLHNTRQDNSFNILVRLFLMELPVKSAQLTQAIEPVDPEQWIEAGLIRRNGEWVTATVRLFPFEHYLFAFDNVGRAIASGDADFVMGISASSRDLLDITVRRHSRLTLDLGTGCGVQGMLAAGHSDRVVALDSNERAVRLAAFNAELNGMTKVEFRTGDLFEPVQGMKFDLVVTNPPFVVSPNVRFIYRDSDPRESICRRIVREVPDYLEEGGFCQMLCNWPEYAHEEWKREIAHWFEGTGCDSWVKRTERYEPAAYAAMWLRSTETLSNEEYMERFGKWMAFFEEREIEAIGSGFIVMQKNSAGKNWFEADADPWGIAGPSGESIENRFRMRRFLEEITCDEELLGLRLQASTDLVLDQRWDCSQGTWAPTGAKLSLSKGLAYEGEIDGSVARFVTSCDGQKTLAELLSAMAASSNVEADTIRLAFLGLARRFIEIGFVEPVRGAIDRG